MNWRKSYAHLKLMVTIHSLATGPGDIRKRLVDAHLIFHVLRREHFPEELQSDWVFPSLENHTTISLQKYTTLMQG